MHQASVNTISWRNNNNITASHVTYTCTTISHPHHEQSKEHHSRCSRDEWQHAGQQRILMVYRNELQRIDAQLLLLMDQTLLECNRIRDGHSVWQPVVLDVDLCTIFVHNHSIDL
jgi:hypothetical protein